MPDFTNQPGKYFAHINEQNFTEIALEVFHYQASRTTIYQEYLNLIGKNPASVTSLTDVPFLPISFFKSHTVLTIPPTADMLYFESSTTTGQIPSRHFVPDPDWYKASLNLGFTRFYGTPGRYAVLALLPSYLERAHASLVYMTQVLMQQSGHPQNGFYLYNHEDLYKHLLLLESMKQPTLLIGVSFALLDFAERYPMKLKHTIVMETGGMKGRRVEWTREQLHILLQERLGVSEIHSEYGMTELLSQAYAPAGGRFLPAPTMRVLMREIQDPLSTYLTGSGALQVVDLANTFSCSFIATEDIGCVYEDGSFTVLGRLDQAALRGCSLMVA